ncbi:MAG TPA: hypothetical protein VHT25_09150 [Solirubrobacteraceae bacterium]|jgi:hypothetical protein|nr:hypothetical protein [Solirubrobacteraceae bacterium]
MSRPSTRRAVILLATAGALLTAAFAVVPQADAATLYACVKKEGGAMRLVSARAKCRRGVERRVSWNTSGPAGRNGANGANGKNGTNGANGKDGSTGKEGIAGPFPGTLPQGITLRGNFNIGGTAATAGDVVEGDISFGFTFASAPTFHYIKAGGATPECPGTAAAPEAAPGNLCAYASVTSNTAGLKTNTTNKWGDTVFVPATAAGSFFDLGTWAATAP